MFAYAQPSKDWRNALISNSRGFAAPTLDYALSFAPHRVLGLHIRAQGAPMLPLASARPGHFPQAFNDGTNHRPSHSPRSRDRQPGALIRISGQSAGVLHSLCFFRP